MYDNEQELIDYDNYLNFIRELIAEESVTKFTSTGYKPRPDEINIRSINAEEESKTGNWTFYYQIKHIRQDPHLHEGKPFTNTVSGMSKKISDHSWKLLLIQENREKRIDELLQGLEPKHRLKLKERGI